MLSRARIAQPPGGSARVPKTEKMGSSMSFLPSLSRPGDDYDDESPKDRTAFWFGLTSLAFIVAGGTVAFPYIFPTGEAVATGLGPTPVVVAQATPSEIAVERPAEPDLAQPPAEPPPSEAVQALRPSHAGEPAPAPAQVADTAGKVGDQPLSFQSEPDGQGAAAPAGQAHVTLPSLPAEAQAPSGGAEGTASTEVSPSTDVSATEVAPASQMKRLDDGAVPSGEAVASIGEGDAGQALPRGTGGPVGELRPAAADASPPVAAKPAIEASLQSEADDGPDEAATPEVEKPAILAKPHGKPFAIAVPATVRATGPDSFLIGNVAYRLSSIDALGIDKKCEIEQDGRCVFHPRGALKKAILGTTLTCKAIDLDASPKIVECVKSGGAKTTTSDATGAIGRADDLSRVIRPAPTTGGGLF